MKQEVLINKKEFYWNLTRLALPIALQSLMLASVAACGLCLHLSG